MIFVTKFGLCLLLVGLTGLNIGVVESLNLLSGISSFVATVGAGLFLATG